MNQIPFSRMYREPILISQAELQSPKSIPYLEKLLEKEKFVSTARIHLENIIRALKLHG